MPRTAVTSIVLATSLALLAGCTSEPSGTVDTSVGDVSGGEVIDPPATAASPTSTQPPATTAQAAPATLATVPPAPDTVADTVADTLATTTTVATTTTTIAVTSTTIADVPDDDDAVGDGPVLTNPIGDGDAGESPGTQTGLTPVFFALVATTEVDCATADPGTVRLRWEVIGAEAVDVSVDFIGNIYSPDESPAGTIDLPLDCVSGSEYFVIAENPDGETIRSVSVG